MALGLIAQPTPAAATVNDFWHWSGWWNNTSDGINDPDGNAGVHYTYPDYPLNCNSTPTGPSVQVLYAYWEGTSGIQLDTNLTAFRNQVDRVNSILAASAEAYGVANKLNDHSMRIITTGSTSPCYTKFIKVPIPYSVVIASETLAMGVDHAAGLMPYLRSLGYNASDRKYLVYYQRDIFACGGGGAVGCTDTPMDPDPDPATNRDNNETGMAIVAHGRYEASTPFVTDPYGKGELAWYTAHEVAHLLGAANGEAPHSDGTGHVTGEGGDVLYEGPDNGYSSTLHNPEPPPPSAPCATFRSQVRLDCLDNDYWDNDGAAWQDVRWNTYRSRFLWGN